MRLIQANTNGNVKHGCCLKSGPERLYKIWIDMKSRCYNQKVKNYHRYGGRGIIVCEEWEHNFIAFKTWAMENGYKDNLQIDRKENNDIYSPNNCRFVTCAKNNQNKNNTKLTMKKAEDIRSLYKTKKGMSYRKIAAIYDVDKALIGRIVKNKVWINLGSQA